MSNYKKFRNAKLGICVTEKSNGKYDIRLNQDQRLINVEESVVLALGFLPLSQSPMNIDTIGTISKTDIKSLKAEAEIILEKFPDTTNSDVALTIRDRKVFHREHLIERHGIRYVALDSLFLLPREDSLKRVRAQIQNKDGRFLPTSREVAKKRGINETVRRQAMGENVKSTLQE